MEKISEIQIHIEKIIDLVHAIKVENDQAATLITDQKNEIDALRRRCQQMADDHADEIIDLENHEHFQLSGMGSISYKFGPNTSQDFVTAFNEFLHDQQQKYIGNATELQFF